MPRLPPIFSLSLFDDQDLQRATNFVSNFLIAEQNNSITTWHSAVYMPESNRICLFLQRKKKKTIMAAGEAAFCQVGLGNLFFLSLRAPLPYTAPPLFSHYSIMFCSVKCPPPPPHPPPFPQSSVTLHLPLFMRFFSNRSLTF